MSQGEVTAMDRLNNVVLDIESLTQPLEKCSGSPKMTVRDEIVSIIIQQFYLFFFKNV